MERESDEGERKGWCRWRERVTRERERDGVDGERE